MDQFNKRMKDYLKDDYDNFKEALTKNPVKSLYFNKKKQFTSLPSLTPHPIVRGGYYYNEDTFKAGKSPYFLTGLYYIQEPSAMITAAKLPLESNDYVLDMCGAPGGKSCAIGMNLSNEGLLITNDISISRAKILSENIERFGLSNTIVTSTNPKNLIGILDNYFDKIILDAPCSGEGMFRSKKQAIETYSEEKIKECVTIQKELIDIAFQLLKPGGLLMYSTCTYNQYENEDIIRYALNHYNFKLVPLSHEKGLAEGLDMPEAIRCYPHLFNGEGQFMALLLKNGSSSKQKVKTIKPHIDANYLKVIKDFYKKYLNIPLSPSLIENNGHIYQIQKHFPDLKKIRILRRGLYLGEVRKSYFTPSYSLALSLKEEDFKYSYNFNHDDPKIQTYIHGDTLESKGNKGYGGILIDHYPLSFYKESIQIKNLFPKGLRRNM